MIPAKVNSASESNIRLDIFFQTCFTAYTYINHESVTQAIETNGNFRERDQVFIYFLRFIL